MTTRWQSASVVVVVLLALWWSNSVGAQAAPDGTRWTLTPFEASPQELLDAADTATVSDPDIEVLLDETRIAIAADGAVRRQHTLVYRLMSVAGIESWGTSEVLWEPWHEARPELRARIVSPDATVAALDPSTISESPAQSTGNDLFDDRRVLGAPLPALAVGAVVEERILHPEIRPELTSARVWSFYPTRNMPVHTFRLVVELPEHRALSWSAELLNDAEPEVSTADGRQQWTWELTAVEPFEDFDPWLPPDVPAYPRLIVGTGDSWSDVAAEYARKVDERVASADLRSLINTLQLEGLPRARVLDTMVEFIRSEIRYSGLELGEAAIIPYPPNTVLERQYGDCKDQATLLVAVLRQLGMKANVVLLDSGWGPDMPTLPGLAGFNHAIVRVDGDEPVWIDTTDRYARAGDLPASDQRRLALVAEVSTTDLIRLPSTTSADNGEIETREIQMSEHGKGSLRSHTVARGSFDREYRWGYGFSDLEETEENLEDWVREEFLTEELTDFTVSDTEDLTAPFELTVEVAESGRAVTELYNGVVGIRLDRLLNHLPSVLFEEDEDTPREQEFLFDDPCTVTWKYVIHPPSGFVPEALPVSEVHELGTVRLEERYSSADDTTVEAVMTLDTGPARVSATQFRDTRAALEGFLERDAILVRFTHEGQLLIDQGRTVEGIRLLRESVAEQPKDALHRVRLARALLSSGIAEAAVDEARAAVAADPSSLLAHKALCWILQHDAVGRRFGTGWNREAAIAAYEAAIQLENADLELYLDRAILLEHDAEGQRYTASSNLDAAISAYRETLEKFADSDQLDDSGKSTIELNLLIARFRAGELEEIVAEHPRLTGTVSTDTVVACAVAVAKSAQDAMAAVRQTYSSAEQRRQVMLNAAQILVQVRHYEQAATLFRAASRGASNATTLLSTATKIARTRRHEELMDPTALGDPEGVVRQMFARINTDHLVAEVFHPQAQDRLAEDSSDWLEEFNDGLMQILESAANEIGVSVDVIVDLSLANMEIRVHGSHSSVRRVHLTADGSRELDETFFVKPVDDQQRSVDGGVVYGILASSEELDYLGIEALAELDHGNIEGARELLDWARELSYSSRADDPLAGDTFSRIWSEGQPRDNDAIRVASQVLIADGEQPDAALGRLEQWVRGGHPHSDLLRLQLVQSYVQLDRPKDAQAHARAVLDAYPRSTRAFLAWCRTQSEQEKWKSLRAAANARLELLPEDSIALRVLADAAQHEGKLDEADTYLEQVLNTTDAWANDYNTRAWLQLFRRSPANDETLKWAHQAVEQGGTGSAALHTLACVYADQEMTAEAYEVMLRALNRRPSREPRSYDWFVFGRVAEAFGLTDSAKEYYQRTAEGDDETESAPLETARLASARLKVLKRS